MDQLKETAASVVDEAPVKSRSPSPDTAGKPADPVEEAAPDLNGDKESSETAAVSSEETKADSSESVDEDAAMTEPSETEDEAGSAEVKELDEVGFAPDEETERAADVEMRLASDVEAKLTSEVEAKLAANLELKLAARVEAKANDVNAVKANTVVSGEVASEDSALVKLLKESAPAKTPPSRGRKRKATSDAAGADENVKKIENMDGVKVKSEDESATDSSSDIKDLVPPGHQQLGKGKRARVPNKRYNDIVPNRASYETSPRPKPLPENGQLTDNEAFIKEELEDELTRRQKKTPKQNLDLTNPNFLKPFKYGWKRELVYRATVDPSQRRNGDIYYYTPSGKKVRSMRELAEQLNDKYLCLEDFTFFKEPLGVNDPEKELIRDAKYKLGVPTALQTALKKACAVSPKSKPSSQVNSPEMPGTSAAATPSINAAATAVAAAANDSSSETKTGKRGRGLKVKMPPLIVKQKEKKQKIEPTEDERLDIAFAANWATTTPSKRGRGSFDGEGNKPCRPCSIRCEGVLGVVPTLQCRLCLCLYHNECVGVQPHAYLPNYICKNCQMEQDPNTTTTAQIAPVSTAPIDTTKPIQPDPPKSEPEPAKSTPKPTNQQQPPPPLPPPPPPETKSILGSVTTWFPRSSTVQVESHDSEKSEPREPIRPQLIEFIGNKKYLIIPRHNIVSFAAPPQPAPTPETPPPEPNCEVKVESQTPPPIPGPAGEPMQVDPASPPLSPHVADRAQEEEVVTVKEEEPVFEAPRSAPVDVKPKPKVSPVKPPAPVVPDKPVEPVRFMDNYMQNISFGYKTLLNVFQYLKVQDLLRAGCVCSMWCDVSRHQSLWSTVRMKNSQIHSFEGMANALQKHGTAHLDLRKMLLPPSGGENIWPSFTRAIAKVDCLRKIELCRCLASVVEDLATNNHKLEAINAVTIKCDAMSFDPLKNLTNLTDLRLKSIVGLTLTSDLSALRELKKLRHLSITSIRSMKRLNIEVIAELVNLEVLDLGECTDFPKHFGPDILCKLTKLEKLRLEKGQGDCHTFDILESVKKLSNLYQLELVNFDIKTDFDKALGGCINIRKLLIIPTYISQSATTNHMVLGGVLRLQKTLTHFVWGVTLELLRVTELFVDQCENPDKKEMSKDRSSSPGDSIPVLKPVPLHGVFPPDSPAPSDTPQVEILPLPNLQKLLLQNLPTTRVKILKVPFHATWRQSITDSVN